MEKYYYNNETDTIESIDVIRSDYYDLFGEDYDLFGEDYDTLEDYITACQWYNNGALTPVSIRLQRVKRELNRKLMLAQKYGYDEYADELADLLEQMDILSKYNRERA